MPGGPIDALVAQDSSGFTFGEQSRRALEEYYGLDESLPSQYSSYLARLTQGDLGRSIATLAPVRDEIGRRLPWTLLLVGARWPSPPQSGWSRGSTPAGAGIGPWTGVFKGEAVSRLTFLNPGTPFPSDLQRELVEKVVSRT